MNEWNTRTRIAPACAGNMELPREGSGAEKGKQAVQAGEKSGAVQAEVGKAAVRVARVQARKRARARSAFCEAGGCPCRRPAQPVRLSIRHAWHARPSPDSVAVVRRWKSGRTHEAAIPSKPLNAEQPIRSEHDAEPRCECVHARSKVPQSCVVQQGDR